MGKGSVQALPTPTPLLPPGGAATTISPTSATSTPGLFLPVQMTSETNVQSLQRPFCLHLEMCAFFPQGASRYAGELAWLVLCRGLMPPALGAPLVRVLGIPRAQSHEPVA